MSSLLLVQSAVAVATTQSDALASHLVQFAVAIILALNVWMVRAVQQTRDLMRRLEQWAFGPNGDNGVNSTVTDHEHRLTATEGYIERTVPERLKQWEAWKIEVDKVVHSANNAANEAVLNHRPRIVSLENDRDNDRRSGHDRRHHE